MKTLIVEKDHQLRIAEVDRPVYDDCQALVKMVSCGICNGTDAKLIHGKFKGFGDDRYPLMLGHEAVGRVIETGRLVEGLKAGDLVLLPFVEDSGPYQSGWGGFSEYGVVSDLPAVLKHAPHDLERVGLARSQTVLPDWVDPVEAVMIITLREVLSSIRRFNMRENDSVVVFGCGPVGQTFIRFLHLLGVKPIIALDIVDDKLELARSLGADVVMNSRDPEITARIRAICPDGVDHVLDAVGVSAIINQAMPLLKDQGAICCYGISPNLDMQLDWSEAPYNWKLHFQQFPAKEEEGQAHSQVMAWLEAGAIRLSDYISDVFPFTDILTAFERLEKKEIALKGIIRFDD